MKHYFKIVVLLIYTCIFLFVSLQKLHLPGYQGDEGFYTTPSLNLIQNRQMSENVVWGINIFGKKFPIMCGPYIGATQVYVLIPFLKIFGEDFRTSRIMPIFLATINIWLTWWLCEILFSTKVAIISCLFLTLNPSYVFWSRVGLIGEGPFLMFLTLVIVILLVKYYKEGKNIYVYIAVFISGIGLYTKINFLFIMMALLTTFVIFTKEIKDKINNLKIYVVVLAFIIGVFPLILYNIMNSFQTINVIFTALWDSTPVGRNNWLIITNGFLRVKQFISMLGGGAYFTTRQKTPNPYFAVLFAVAYIYLCIKLLRDRDVFIKNRKIGLILLIETILFICNCFTLSGFYNHHLYIIYPFPFITVALFLDVLFEHSSIFKKISLGIILVGVIFNIKVIYEKYKFMEKTGERAEWSDAIYHLAEYLVKNKVYQPIIFDHRTRYNVEVLTKGIVKPRYREKNNDIDRNYIILLEPICNPEKEQRLFLKEVNNSIHRLNLIKTFSNRIGEPVFSFYTIERDINKK